MNLCDVKMSSTNIVALDTPGVPVQYVTTQPASQVIQSTIPGQSISQVHNVSLSDPQLVTTTHLVPGQAQAVSVQPVSVVQPVNVVQPQSTVTTQKITHEVQVDVNADNHIKTGFIVMVIISIIAFILFFAGAIWKIIREDVHMWPIILMALGLGIFIVTMIAAGVMSTRFRLRSNNSLGLTYMAVCIVLGIIVIVLGIIIVIFVRRWMNANTPSTASSALWYLIIVGIGVLIVIIAAIIMSLLYHHRERTIEITAKEAALVRKSENVTTTHTTNTSSSSIASPPAVVTQNVPVATNVTTTTTQNPVIASSVITPSPFIDLN